MMKRLMMLMLVALPALLNAQTGQYVINGEITNLKKPVKVYLVVPRIKIKDSTLTVNGKFKFEGLADNQAEQGVIITIPGSTKQKTDMQWVYVEKGLIKIKIEIGQPNNTVISGTPANRDLMALNVGQATIREKSMKIQAQLKEARSNKDNATIIAKSKEMEVFKKQSYSYMESFIKLHPQSVVSLLCLRSLIGNQDVTKLNKMFNSLSPSLRSSPEGNGVISSILQDQRAIQVGTMAPNFALKNTKNKLVRLSSLQGQYVLVDFWASWCGPCRLENPNLVKCYKQYKNRNFTILGVSADGDKSKWLAAVSKDSLRWPNVLVNIKDKKNNANALYHISSWPQNFLLDPNGRVIAKNLRGDALDAKLAEVLAKAEKVKAEE